MALWTTAAAAAHVAVPLALARRGRRLGWGATGPGRLNLLGLLPVGTGASVLAWCYVSHRTSSADESIRISLTPEYLVASGPYRFSRNPMYVAEQSMWLGWSLFFGSRRVLTAAALLALGMNVAVRREERTLDSQFGATWKQYERVTPRWL